MKRYATLVAVFSLVTLGAAQSAPLTNGDIVALVKAGVPSSVVAAKIQTSPCVFDTSTKALADMHNDGVPEDIMGDVVLAKCSTGRTAVTSLLPPVTDDRRAQQEKLRRSGNCPNCPFVTVVMMADDKPMLGGLSKNQVSFLKSDVAKMAAPGARPTFILTDDWPDSKYILVWWAGSRSYSYSYFFPRTTTSTTSTNGAIGSDPVWATSSTRSTTYIPQTAARNQTIVRMEIFDAATGALVFNTSHVGNFRWSEPDKDCLEDAVKFLHGFLAQPPQK